MNNVGTNGLYAYMIASKTMPVGFKISQFADDADSIQIHEAQTGEARLDLNGRIVSYAAAVPLTVTFAVIANSAEDQILAVIYNANRAAVTSKLAHDSINVVINFPNGGIRTLVKGRIISGVASSSAAADGRMPGNIYTFAFGDQYSLSAASIANTVVGALRGAIGV